MLVLKHISTGAASTVIIGIVIPVECYGFGLVDPVTKTCIKAIDFNTAPISMSHGRITYSVFFRQAISRDSTDDQPTLF